MSVMTLNAKNISARSRIATTSSARVTSAIPASTKAEPVNTTQKVRPNGIHSGTYSTFPDTLVRCCNPKTIAQSPYTRRTTVVRRSAEGESGDVHA